MRDKSGEFAGVKEDGRGGGGVRCDSPYGPLVGSRT